MIKRSIVTCLALVSFTDYAHPWRPCCQHTRNQQFSIMREKSRKLMAEKQNLLEWWHKRTHLTCRSASTSSNDRPYQQSRCPPPASRTSVPR
jgi:hypothetical protein